MIKGNFPPFLSSLILCCIEHIDMYKSKDIGLADNEVTNRIYLSKRSKFKYLYLRTFPIMVLNYIIIIYLYFKTGKLFNNTVNLRCMPINFYTNGDIIYLHKDRDMFHPERPITDILVITLNQKGTSYFNLIRNVESSPDGKQITVLPKSTENVYKTKENTFLMFSNIDSAHELTCISGVRISLTYRR